MKNFYTIIVLLCLTVFSCNDKKTVSGNKTDTISSYPYTINVSEGLKNQTIIKLSDVADSIRYVILSKDKTVAVNFVFEVALTDSNIITSVSQCPFLIFDLSGKFLDTIGRFGRGPEEYMQGSKFSVDPASGDIIVYRNFLHEYIFFDPDGRFKGKHSRISANSIESFESLGGSKFAIFPIYDGREVAEDNIRKNMILLGLFDRNGNKLSGISHPARNIPEDFIPLRFITGTPTSRNTYFNNEVVTQCYENTVYKINPDSIYTGFIINWDRLPVPETFEEKYYFRSSAKNSFAEIRGKFFETGTYAYFLLDYEKKRALMAFEKLTGRTNSMALPGQNKAGFINDLDGGQQFFPIWTNREGDIWIDFVEAIDMKSRPAVDFSGVNATIDPIKKQKLLNFVGGLQPDDNPVLRIVYLKQAPDDL